MALIQCPECGKDVSNTTYKCPHCGFVINEPKRSAVGVFFELLFVAFNFIMVFIIGSFMLGIFGNGEESAAVAGTIGTGILITIWIIGALPLGIMSYITRPKVN